MMEAIKVHLISHKLRTAIWTIFVSCMFLPTLVCARIEFDPAALETWADETFGKALAERRFSGLVVTLVQDGEIKLLKGYGYHDFALKNPIDPGKTRFHLASNTKPFTATAIAQLVDKELIESLDDPANKYLTRFQLDSGFGNDISLWHLLTHRAGFEDYLVHVGNVERDITVPVTGDVIIGMMPEIVREPGKHSEYSNFSTAVLGAVVEDLTGMTLANYMEKEIFEPLGMSDTELRYSVDRADGLGVPYAFFSSGEAQRIPHVPFHPFFAAAGGLVSTAPDMALFIQALLTAGRSGESAILSPEMFDVMRTVHARNHPEVAGIGMKFRVSKYADQVTFGHGGGWPGWYSTTAIFPESNAGYFAAVMSDAAVPTLFENIFGSDRMRPSSDNHVGPAFEISDLISSFLITFLGPAQTVDKIDSAPNIDNLVGMYWREKRSHTRMDALFELMEINDSVIRVDKIGQDSLRINGRGPFKPISPDTFGIETDPAGIQAAGPVVLASTVTFSDKYDDGTLKLLSSTGVFSHKKAGVFRNPLAMRYLLIFASLVGITGFLAVCWRDVVGSIKVLQWFSILLAMIILLSTFIIYGGFAEGDYWRLYKLSGRTPRFIMLAILGNLACILSVGIIVSITLGWRKFMTKPGNSLYSRLHAALIAAAAVALVVVLEFLNMIGLHLPA